MEKCTLTNKKTYRIKVFQPFEDVHNPNPRIDAMITYYLFFYKRSSKTHMKDSRVDIIENVRKEY